MVELDREYAGAFLAFNGEITGLLKADLVGV